MTDEQQKMDEFLLHLEFDKRVQERSYSSKDDARKHARELYWRLYDKETYQCPDCARPALQSVEDRGDMPARAFPTSFQIHHKDGNPMNNSLQNLVALCNPCHQARHGGKTNNAEWLFEVLPDDMTNPEWAGDSVETTTSRLLSVHRSDGKGPGGISNKLKIAARDAEDAEDGAHYIWEEVRNYLVEILVDVEKKMVEVD